MIKDLLENQELVVLLVGKEEQDVMVHLDLQV